MLQILLLHAYAASVGIEARLGSYYGTKRSMWVKPVAIDDVYECDEVARNAQLELFFQRIEGWFDALSKQLTTLAVGSQPQNYHPNPYFVVEEEEDLDIKQEGYDIKEDDEYIERVCPVDWDSPPIYDDYLEDFSQGKKIELDKNKVIYI